MNRGRDRRRIRIDDQRRYGKLENCHDAKASEKFHTPAYQSYEVTDFLKKIGINVTGESNNDKRSKKKWIRIL